MQKLTCGSGHTKQIQTKQREGDAKPREPANPASKKEHDDRHERNVHCRDETDNCGNLPGPCGNDARVIRIVLFKREPRTFCGAPFLNCTSEINCEGLKLVRYVSIGLLRRGHILEWIRFDIDCMSRFLGNMSIFLMMCQ